MSLQDSQCVGNRKSLTTRSYPHLDFESAELWVTRVLCFGLWTYIAALLWIDRLWRANRNGNGQRETIHSRPSPSALNAIWMRSGFERS